MRADGSVVYVSPTVQDILGISPEDYAAQITELVHPDDRATAGDAVQKVYEDPTYGQTVEVRVRLVDGTWHIFDTTVINALDNPEIAAVIWLIADTTTRRVEEARMRAEESRFRLMVEYSHDLFLIIDDQFDITWANHRLRSMTGYSHDEVIGQPVLNFLHRDEVQLAEAELLKVLDGHAPEGPITLRVRSADGTWIWVEVVGLDRMTDEGDTFVPQDLLGGSMVCIRDVTTRRNEKLALEAAEQRFRALVENSGDVVVVLNTEFTVTYTSPSMFTVFGYPPEQITTSAGLEWVHPDDIEHLALHLNDLMKVRGHQYIDTCRVLRADGEWRWVEATITSYLDDPAVHGVVANLRDVTTRIEAERAAQRLLDIFETTNDYVVVLSPEGAILHLNAAGKQILGVDENGPVPKTPSDGMLAPHELDRLSTAIYKILESSSRWDGEFDLMMADGTTTPMLTQILTHFGPDGEVEFYSVSMRDISDRKAFEAELSHQATHDSLTGLPNRTLLVDRLSVAIARAKRQSTTVGVLFLDLDHFKVVNDSRGHSLGDSLLKEIAIRLALTLRPDDTIARFGGDEFVVLCGDLAGPEEAVRVGERIEEMLGNPFILDGTELFIGASIGISFLSGADPRTAMHDPQRLAEELIREADAAMYRAKDRGRGQITVYDDSLRATTVHRLELDTALRYALERDELVVYYQPIFDLTSGHITRVEALVRWQHPKYGLMAPDNFIPLAEDTGLIIPLGRIVFTTACEQLARWQQKYDDLNSLTMSINISGRQLANPSLVSDIESVIVETGINPAHLDIEITESLLMDDVEFSLETLTRLKDLTVNIAVDDFGTGYSSLSYLRSFPVDYLKIDRSFVAGLSEQHGDEAIVVAIIRLAQTLGLKTIAEGVETADQLNQLRRFGCDLAQGFLLATPMPSGRVEDVLTRPPSGFPTNPLDDLSGMGHS